MKPIFKYSLVAEPVGSSYGAVRSCDTAEAFLRSIFEDITIQESFYVLFLNNSNDIMGYRRISVGGITYCIVEPSIVAKYAIETLCKGVILCHNHPSGKMSASEEDKRITKKIQDGLALFDIKVIDHIILAPGSGCYSFTENGLI